MENIVKTADSILLKELVQVYWYQIYENHYDDHVLERTFPQDEHSSFYLRKKDNPDQIYIAKTGDRNNLECLKCGVAVLQAQVAHPIKHTLFSIPGSEKSCYETVPYCPGCEEEPNPNGTPIGTGT